MFKASYCSKRSISKGNIFMKLKMVLMRRLTFDTVCQLSRWLDVVEASSSSSNKAMCWFAVGAWPHWHHRCCELWICPCMYLPGIQSLNFRPCVGILLEQSIEFWRKCKIVFYSTGFLASLHCLIALTSSLLWWIMTQCKIEFTYASQCNVLAKIWRFVGCSKRIYW